MAPRTDTARHMVDIGVRNILADAGDDWYRDPWRYPEFRIARDRHRPLPSLAAQPVTPPAQIQIPKVPSATRPASFLMPVDRLRYQIAVDELTRTLETSLQASTFGWRLQRPTHPGTYRSQRHAWQECLTTLRRHARRYDHMVFVDIADFFNSIRLDRLDDMLHRARARTGLRRHLADMLAGFYADSLPFPGIPQNHLPSAILANSFVDVALTGVAASRGSSAVVRWMDDIWIFGTTERAATQAHHDVEGALRGAGLRLNASKTMRYAKREVAEAVEGTTVSSRSADRRARRRAVSLPAVARCDSANEAWQRATQHADHRVVDSLTATVMYDHECPHPCHDHITATMTEIAATPASSPARFAPAVRWLTLQRPALAREVMRSTLPLVTDPYNARSATLAALTAGEDRRWLIPAARRAPVDGLLMRYLVTR
jgi:hypothetical protein